jgi:hypothetical protein
MILTGPSRIGIARFTRRGDWHADCWIQKLTIAVAVQLAVLAGPRIHAAFAQQPPPTSNGASDVQPTPDAAAIQSRITELEQASSLDDNAKAELSLLKEAQKFLQEGAEASNRATALDNLLAGAPEQIRNIQQQLEQPLESEPNLGGDATLDSLRSRLAQAQADIEAQHTLRQQLEQESADRDARRMELPTLAGAARARLDEISASLATPSSVDAGDRVAAARLLRLQAERGRLQNLLRRYELEQRSDESQRDLLRLRRQLVERHIRQAETRVEVLRNAVTD